MASSYLTSSTLIESVKRRQAVPESQVTFEEADFLAFANEEIALGLLPTILQYHEEYLVYTATIPLVANTSSYAIPYRAVGNRIRHIHYEDSAGNILPLAKIDPADEAFYQEGANTATAPLFFYLRNNMIVLVPSVGASPSGSLVVSYYMRPGQLVSEERAVTIDAIDTSTGVLTVSEVPSGMTAGISIDFVETKGGHRTKGMDVSISAVTGTTLTVDAASLPDDLVVGDYLCFAGETVIPQIPDDLHPMLAQRVSARCLEALGDVTGLQAANAKLQEMETKTATLVDNRAESTPTKVVNWRGPLRRGRR